MRSPPDRAVRVRALAGDISLCYRGRYFTLTVPAKVMLGVINPAMDWHLIEGEKKYSKSLHATETGIKFGLIGLTWLIYKLNLGGKGSHTLILAFRGHC